MRKQFDIKYRPQIESGEYKVETRDGKPVRVVCWDRAAKESQPKALKLCVLVQEDGGESVYYYYPDGTKWDARDDYDLFLITPEPELSEFEDKLRIICENAVKEAYLSPGRTSEEFAKNHAAELLSLARDQFIKDGYVIEKKAFHDAVENISDKHLAEMSVQYSLHCKVKDGTRHAVMNWSEFQKLAQKFIEIGKAEALKDLPRWKKGNIPKGEIAIRQLGISQHAYSVKRGGYEGDSMPTQRYILISDLEKLPRFKEDE